MIEGKIEDDFILPTCPFCNQKHFDEIEGCTHVIEELVFNRDGQVRIVSWIRKDLAGRDSDDRQRIGRY